MSFAQEMKDAVGGFKAGSSIINENERNRQYGERVKNENALYNARAEYYKHFSASAQSGPNAVDPATAAGTTAQTAYANTTPGGTTTQNDTSAPALAPTPTPSVPSTPTVVSQPPTFVPPEQVQAQDDANAQLPTGGPARAASVGAIPGYADGGMYDPGADTPTYQATDYDEPAPQQTAALPNTGDGSLPIPQPVAAPVAPPSAPVAARGRGRQPVSTALPVPDSTDTNHPSVYHGSIPAQAPFNQSGQQDMPESVLGAALHSGLSFIQNIFGLGGGNKTNPAALPAYDPRMGNDIYYADGTPYPLDPNTGQPIRGAVEGRPVPGQSPANAPTQNPAIATNPNHGVMMLAHHVGAMSPSEFTQIRQIVDPDGKLDEHLGNIAAINGMYNYYMQHGDVKKAQQSAATMIMTMGQMSSQLGAQAQKAVVSGDYPKAVSLLKRAYDFVPDGNSTTVQGGDNGTGTITVQNPNGQVIHQQTFTPKDIFAAATGMQTGSLFWNQLIQSASAYTKIKPENLPGYEPPPPDEVANKAIAGLQNTGAGDTSTAPATPPAATTPALPTGQTAPTQTIDNSGPAGAPAATTAAPTQVASISPATPPASVAPSVPPTTQNAVPVTAPVTTPAAPTPTPTPTPTPPSPGVPPPTSFAVPQREVPIAGFTPMQAPPPFKPPHNIQSQLPNTDGMTPQGAAEYRRAWTAAKQANVQALQEYKTQLQEYRSAKKERDWQPGAITDTAAEKFGPGTVDDTGKAAPTPLQQTLINTVATRLPDPTTGKPATDQSTGAQNVSKVLDQDALNNVAKVAMILRADNAKDLTIKSPDNAMNVALGIALNPQDPSKPNFQPVGSAPGGNGVVIKTVDGRSFALSTQGYDALVNLTQSLAQKYAAAKQAVAQTTSRFDQAKNTILGGIPRAVAGTTGAIINAASAVPTTLPGAINSAKDTASAIGGAASSAYDAARSPRNVTYLGPVPIVTQPQPAAPAAPIPALSPTQPEYPHTPTPAFNPMSPYELRAYLQQQYPGVNITPGMLQAVHQRMLQGSMPSRDQLNAAVRANQK